MKDFSLILTGFPAEEGNEAPASSLHVMRCRQNSKTHESDAFLLHVSADSGLRWKRTGPTLFAGPPGASPREPWIVHHLQLSSRLFFQCIMVD